MNAPTDLLKSVGVIYLFLQIKFKSYEQTSL